MKLLKILKGLVIAILTIAVIVTTLNIIPMAPQVSKDSKFRISKGEQALNIPHGGAKNLYPENTKYSFDHSALYEVFEIDLSMTKDDVLISHHDTNLASSLTNFGEEKITGAPDIIDITFQELKDTLVAANFPYASTFVSDNSEIGYTFNGATPEEYFPVSLEYMFETYPDALYILEIKDTTENSGGEAFVKASSLLKDLIEEYEMKENVVVASFDDNVMKEFRSLDATIPTGLAWNEMFMFVALSALFLDFFYFPKAEVAMIPQYQTISKTGTTGKLLAKIPGFITSRIATEDGDNYLVDLGTKRIINDLHRHGIAVIFWTINDEDEMKKLINLGADGIITDRPDILVTLLS